MDAKVLGGITLGTALVVGGYRSRKEPVRHFLLAFPAIMLAPAIWQVNRFLVGVDAAAIAERFLYVPAVAVALLAGFALDRGAGARRKCLAAGAFLVIAVFMVLSSLANRLWSSDLVLFRAVARSAPETVFAHVNLGYALRKRGDLEAAVGEYRQALALMPGNPGAHVGLGIVYQQQGRFGEAIEEYRIASALLPEAHDRDMVYAIQGRGGETAREDRAAPRMQPSSFAAHLHLGMVYHQAGQLENAVREYRLAAGLNPASAEARNNLGVILHRKGQREEALGEFEAAVRLRPDSSLAVRNLESARRGGVDEDRQTPAR